MKWDAAKGLSLISYNRYNTPNSVQFSNGNRTEYVYSSTGERLRTIYYTAVPNITVPIGSSISLDPSNTLSVDSINYYGEFIFENGQLSKYLFIGGYATIANGQPTYHYYEQDHLGNNRAVISHSGTVEQVTHYYPFGAVYGDAGSNDALQRYKYNGKELDRMHGLNFYDYGARQYDPLLCRFTQVDPLAEKYYDISPYAYCKDNPLKYIDPDGKSVWSKGLKGFVKVGRSVVKNGVSALNKADTYLDAFSDITEAINTIADSEASVGDKVVAGLSLASELLPVSVEDVKDAGKVVKTIGNKGRPGTIIAKENGITIKTYGTNDAHKPAHAHVTGKGSEVRVGPNGKPLKGQPELSTQQKRVVDNHKKALRKEVKAIGKENKKLEENGKNY